MSNDKTGYEKIIYNRIFKIYKELLQTIMYISNIYGRLISLNERNYFKLE